MDSKRRKTGADQDVSALRLASRQKYLAEREAQQLALLRRQVAEEAEEEERLGSKLSEAEKREFARNRETLRLAEARNAIDDNVDGRFFIPDADYSNKHEALTKRHKDRDADYRSEAQLWEEDQLKKINAQPRAAQRVQEQDYEYVFDASQNVAYDGPIVDLEKQRLEALVDEAEKHAASIEEVRRSLPVYKYKDDFIKALQTEQILVFVGETGSGKTTQLTQYLYEAGFAKDGRIGCTQPRRVAAMSVAKRVAEEAGVRLGKEVGYQVRFEEKFDPVATKIVYLTDGLLLKQALTSPLLDEYSVIVLDEAHERTIATDVLMVLTREITRCRPDFRLVIASATLNAQFFSTYFDSSPILSVPGRSYPVQRLYTQSPEANYLSAALTTFWQIHASQPPGDVLIFLTGEEEIVQAAESIETTAKKLGNRMAPVVVAPVYGALPSENQALIFNPVPKDGSRKCVIATNIAETSLTIDGIVYVIDTGLVKQKKFDSRLGTETLSVVPCSQASSSQRAGRAGRTQPGLCFHLFTKFAFYNELPEATEPEILRSSLDSVILMLKSMHVHDILNFDLPSKPSSDAMIASLENLYALGFLDSEGQVSKLGRRASELPLDPKLAKALLAADSFGCVDEMVTLVAMVSEAGTLFFAPKDKKAAADLARQRFASEHGDMISLLNLWNEFEEAGFSKIWCQDNFVQYRSLNRVHDVRDQLFRLIDKVEIERSSCGAADHVKIMKSWTSAYFANTARLNKDGMSYRCLSSSSQVWIHPSSCLRDKRPRLICYFEQVETSKSWVRTVAPIEAPWLSELAPHYFKKGQLDDLDMGKKMPKAATNMVKGR
jgi:pre-mRNA-splicing factor ATP-dependent RNA helicase DHX16